MELRNGRPQCGRSTDRVPRLSLGRTARPSGDSSGRPRLGPSVSGGNGFINLSGIYATPHSEQLLAVVDGAALLVRADDSSSARSLGPMVTQILGVPEPQLVLLINRNISAAAIDAGGVRWQTQRLCWDDLTIECVMGEEVHCSGEFMPRGSSVLDLQSGDQLSGPRYAK
jgi:hypothetical protein